MGGSRGLLMASIAFAVASCSLFTDLGPLQGGSLDGGASDGSIGDSATDGSGVDGSARGDVVLANAGSVSTATGNAQQTHVIWAIASKNWWLFYIDADTKSLKTRYSSDFVTWTDGATFALPYTNSGEGRNFSVAYASLAGVDVVHISFSHEDNGTQRHTHTRAVISGTTITFGSSADVCSVSDDTTSPDSPADIILADGTVWDSTGDVVSMGTSQGHFNEDVFLASAMDTGGGAWSATFAQTTVEIVDSTVNARALVSADNLYAFWEGGDQDPDPMSVHGAVFQSGSWANPPADLFPHAEQDPNDWDVAVVGTGPTSQFHLVRARLDGSYDHVFGLNVTTATAPATLARSPGNGLVMLADPNHLAIVDTLQDGTLEMAKWSESGSSTWSSWAAISSPGSRRYLSGFCPDLSAYPEAGGCALIWTAQIGGGYQIVGRLLQPGP